MNRRYLYLVMAHREALGDRAKMARDLAIILDHDATQLKKLGNRWIGPVHQRFRAFSKLRSIFVGLNITVSLEPEEGFSQVMVHVNHVPGNNSKIPVPRPLKVIIVDDAREELMDSALVLIGIPRVELELFHYDPYCLTNQTQ